MVSLDFGLCCLGQRATHKLPFRVGVILVSPRLPDLLLLASV